MEVELTNVVHTFEALGPLVGNAVKNGQLLTPRCELTEPDPDQKAWTERVAQGDVGDSTNAILDRVAANPNDVILTRILKEFRRSDRRN